MKTRRLGSIRPWYFFHCARRRATSGRSCSAACRLFFERQLFGPKEVPDRLAGSPGCRGPQAHFGPPAASDLAAPTPVPAARPAHPPAAMAGSASPSARPPGSPSAACAATISPRSQHSPRTAEPSPGSSDHPQPRQLPDREDQENRVVTSMLASYPSQHLESHFTPPGNPLRFRPSGNVL